MGLSTGGGCRSTNVPSSSSGASSDVFALSAGSSRSEVDLSVGSRDRATR